LTTTRLNILIIGGNGFIGSHLVEVLKNIHKVTVFDKSSNQFVKEHHEVDYIYGDFGNTALVSKALDDKDLVYHLLSTTVPFTADFDIIFDIESNLINTIKLLDLIVKKEIKRFVYASSGGTVYGTPKYLPIDEKHPCRPLGSYGIIKKTIEDYIQMYALKHQFSYLIVRPSNPYGPRQSYLKNQGLIAKLIYCRICNDKFTVWGDGSAIRDYIYISDLVDFFKIAGLSNTSGIFNVGSGEGMSILQIIDSLSKVIEKLPLIEFTEKKGNFVEQVILDTSLARSTFDWSPKIALEEGLRRHYSWMISQIDV